MSRHQVREQSAFDCGDGLHRVAALNSDPQGRLIHRAKPCEQCPWRADLPPGVFPASAYRHSAATVYDMAQTTFACHMIGKVAPATCAGFLLRGADHNLSIRLAMLDRRYDPRRVSGGGYPLHISYRAMAIANGVPADDPALALCRGADEDWEALTRKQEEERTYHATSDL
jgi:hypothetical protein